MCAYLKEEESKSNLPQKAELELVYLTQIFWLKISATNHNIFSSIIHENEG